MKKRMMMLGCALAAGITLVSCNSKKEDNGFKPKLDTEKEVVLTVQGGWDNFEALDEVEKQFNEYYPNVSISYSKYSKLNTVLENDGAAGNVDLIFNTKTGSTWKDGDTGKLYAQYMVDLNETDIPLSNIQSDSLVCGKSDAGAQYGIHIYQDMSGLIVNTDLLKQKGFDVPTSLTEFETVCDAFAAMDKENHPILAYYKEQGRVMATLTYANIIKASNRAEIVNNLNNGILDESIVTDSVTKYNSWVGKGYINEASDSLGNNYNAVILEFFKGNIPFAVGTAGTFSGCKKRETADGSTYSEHPFNYTFMSMPTGDNENITLSVPSSMFSVLNTSLNKDYAIEFLRFAVEPESMKTFADIKGMPTTTTTQSADSIFSEFSKYKNEDFYTVTGINLSITAHSKIRESLDKLRTEGCTATTIKEKYADLMGVS